VDYKPLKIMGFYNPDISIEKIGLRPVMTKFPGIDNLVSAQAHN